MDRQAKREARRRGAAKRDIEVDDLLLHHTPTKSRGSTPKNLESVFKTPVDLPKLRLSTRLSSSFASPHPEPDSDDLIITGSNSLLKVISKSKKGTRNSSIPSKVQKISKIKSERNVRTGKESIQRLKIATTGATKSFEDSIIVNKPREKSTKRPKPSLDTNRNTKTKPRNQKNVVNDPIDIISPSIARTRKVKKEPEQVSGKIKKSNATTTKRRTNQTMTNKITKTSNRKTAAKPKTDKSAVASNILAQNVEESTDLQKNLAMLKRLNISGSKRFDEISVIRLNDNKNIKLLPADLLSNFVSDLTFNYTKKLNCDNLLLKYQELVINHFRQLIDVTLVNNDLLSKIKKLKSTKSQLRSDYYTLRDQHLKIGTALETQRHKFNDKKTEFNQQFKLNNLLSQLHNNNNSKEGNNSTEINNFEINNLLINKLINPNHGLLKNLQNLNSKLEDLNNAL